MNLYFAPMEGITGYIYRNAHKEMFGMCDVYFAPFLVPTEHERISRKTLRDILPEKNIAVVIPQVLSGHAGAFLEFSKKIEALGFSEVNLNLGCPSGTVVKKKRGAGALKDVEFLDSFLHDIFAETTLPISVKTRAGFWSHEEFDELLRIFNQYPIKELMIHPRVREEYYKGIPNLQTFEKAYQGTELNLCYNGNITTVQEYREIRERYPRLHSIMIGRGAVKNPAIFREIRGGEPLKTEELLAFFKVLEERYLAVLESEVYTLHRMKELWLYAMDNFPEETKILKAVKKANRLGDLNGAVQCLPMLKKGAGV
ncbi:MAG: tRNA-dihydrouridine synthase family protein [Clostridia bacterium]|nr:tRNA-dihydrouridine synthase family protein [Clostridia bacterium]